MIIEIEKVHEGVRSPSRANPSDAGADVFYCPEEPIVKRLKAGESALFPTGLKFEVPYGYMLEVKNRSGMAAKRHLIVGACVVDSGYDGEVFVNLHNIGVMDQVIYPRDKIAQVVLIPVVPFRTRETKKGLYSEPITISNRGAGALGSTGD